MASPRPARSRVAVTLATLLAAAGVGVVATTAVMAGPARVGSPGPHPGPGRPAATAAATAPAPVGPRRPPYGPVPAPGRAFFGIATAAGPYDLRQYDAAAAAAGKSPSVLLYSQGWAHDRFDRRPLDRLAARGVLPMIAWEPWDYAASAAPARLHGVQPRFALDRIIDGSDDAYIRSWAVGLRDWGHPVALRFAHEMNGNWYPWSEQVNGNRPGQYVAAWRHVHDIFTAAGARNVTWVWSPNIAYPGSQPLRTLYPGDRYVDWVGLVGYYGRPRSGPAGYPTFDDLFGPTLAQLEHLTGKPIVITETGGVEVGGHKAAWISDFFAGLRRHPEIRGFVWFDVVKEADWRFTSSGSARAAFATGVRASRFQAAAAR